MRRRQNAANHGGLGIMRQRPPQPSVPAHAAPGQPIARAPNAEPPALLAALREDVFFLRGFLHQPQQVGSVIPSSVRLEQRLVAEAQLSRASTVVELGPGTGGTTRAFLRAMRGDARLLAIELSSLFHGRLSRTLRDPRLSLQLGSAEDLPRFLAERGWPAPDAIISGIPFSTMPPAVGDRIAAAIAQVLAPQGRFVAYQVRPHVAHYASRYLGEPQAQWEWINIPPMRVFTWTRPQ